MKQNELSMSNDTDQAGSKRQDQILDFTGWPGILCQPASLMQAELSVNILGSSIAMLTGQKPPFRLLVRAINSNTGQRVGDVHHAVSNAFVVATQRVKGAQKAEIPHVEEHVSKIENVGVQTQHKLQDIRAAAQAAGITGLNIVHNTVNTGATRKPSHTSDFP